jgi:hypothetical protein
MRFLLSVVFVFGLGAAMATALAADALPLKVEQTLRQAVIPRDALSVVVIRLGHP